MDSSKTNLFSGVDVQVYSAVTAITNNYTAKLHSRPQYASAQRELFAELFRFLAFCDFADALNFDIYFYTDNLRYRCKCDYTETAETELTSAQIPNFRNVLEIVPPEGLTGQYFEYKIEKIIPDTGVFNWRGGDFKLIGRPELSPEFISPSSAIVYGWTT